MKHEEHLEIEVTKKVRELENTKDEMNFSEFENILTEESNLDNLETSDVLLDHSYHLSSLEVDKQASFFALLLCFYLKSILKVKTLEHQMFLNCYEIIKHQVLYFQSYFNT